MKYPARISSYPAEQANGCELPVLGPQAQVSGRGSLPDIHFQKPHPDYLVQLPLNPRSAPASDTQVALSCWSFG